METDLVEQHNIRKLTVGIIIYLIITTILLGCLKFSVNKMNYFNDVTNVKLAFADVGFAAFFLILTKGILIVGAIFGIVLMIMAITKYTVTKNEKICLIVNLVCFFLLPEIFMLAIWPTIVVTALLWGFSHEEIKKLTGES